MSSRSALSLKEGSRTIPSTHCGYKATSWRLERRDWKSIITVIPAQVSSICDCSLKKGFALDTSHKSPATPHLHLCQCQTPGHLKAQVLYWKSSNFGVTVSASCAAADWRLYSPARLTARLDQSNYAINPIAQLIELHRWNYTLFIVLCAMCCVLGVGAVGAIQPGFLRRIWAHEISFFVRNPELG